MNLFSCRLFVIFSLILLTACSPHPATGVWVSSDNNELGLSKLIIAFEGRAEFTSSKPVEAKWHCFWGKNDDQTLSLDCMPSTNTGKAKQFTLTSIDKDNAEFRENGKLLSVLKRINENPVLEK